MFNIGACSYVWQLRLGWLGIRCFSVLFALQMVFQGATLNHIFGANDADAASAYVFSASVFVFMGVLPSNRNRRRVIGLLKRLTLSGRRRARQTLQSAPYQAATAHLPSNIRHTVTCMAAHEECEATTIGAFIGQMGRDRALAFAASTFCVIDGQELDAADFATGYVHVTIQGEAADATRVRRRVCGCSCCL